PTMGRRCSISRSKATATRASATRRRRCWSGGGGPPGGGTPRWGGRRVAALEGGIDALCVASGQAAVHYATLNVSGLGTNIVSVPQLYGTTHTLFAHLLPTQGVTVRFAASQCPEARSE